MVVRIGLKRQLKKTISQSPTQHETQNKIPTHQLMKNQLKASMGIIKELSMGKQ